MRRRRGATLAEILIATAVLALCAAPMAWGLVTLTRAERDLSLALDRAASTARAVRRVMKDGTASTGFVQLTSTDGRPVEAFKRRDGGYVSYSRADNRLTRIVHDAAGRPVDEEVVARDVRYLHLVTLERGLHLALEVRPEAPVIGAAPRGVEVATAVAVRGW